MGNRESTPNDRRLEPDGCRCVDEIRVYSAAPFLDLSGHRVRGKPRLRLVARLPRLLDRLGQTGPDVFDRGSVPRHHVGRADPCSGDALLIAVEKGQRLGGGQLGDRVGDLTGVGKHLRMESARP